MPDAAPRRTPTPSRHFSTLKRALLPALLAGLLSAAAILAAPLITAEKTYTIVNDVDGHGRADPGDTIEYTITVTNRSCGDALDLVISDNLDEALSLVPGSVNVSPLAIDDWYETIGNTLLAVNAAPSGPAVTSTAALTDNDIEFLGDTFTVTAMDAVSLQGGVVTDLGGGAFTYLPPVGFTGTDIFTYTLTDSQGLTSAARVTVIVKEMVWYVDNSLAVNGDGRSTSPFNTISAVNSADDPDGAGEIIYVFSGGSSYGSITLEDRQRLTGEGVALTVAGIELAGAGDRPVFTSTDGPVITLANGSSVEGLEIDAASGPGIFANWLGGSNDIRQTAVHTSGTGSGVSLVNYYGTFTFEDGSIDGNGSGHAVNVDGWYGNSIFTNVVIEKTAGPLVSVRNKNNGNVTFSGGSLTVNTGAVRSSTPAITLENNTGSTITTFDAGFQVEITGAAGLKATNGGTLIIGGENSSISAQDASAIDASGLTIGGSGAVFATLDSSSSTGYGLRLENVSGALTAHGGSLSGAAQAAVRLSGSNNDLTYAGHISGTSNGRAVEVVNHSGGTVTFIGTVSCANTTSTCIQLQNNTNPSVIRFTGETSISNSGSPALSVLGGTADVSFTNLTIKQTNGNAAITASNVAGGSLILEGSSSVTVSGSSTGRDAITLDGAGSAYRVSIPSITLDTSSMQHGMVLSDLGAGSEVTVSSGSITTAGTGRRLVHFSGTTNGTFDLSGVSLSGNASGGLYLGENQLGEYRFGDVDLIAPVGGTGVTAVGAAKLTFKSISQTEGATGISLNNVTAFTVTGSETTAGSGGTLQNLTGDAVFLKDVSNVALHNMQIQDTAGSGVYGTGVSGFSLTGCQISDTGDAPGEHGVYIENLTGEVSILDSTFQNAAEDNLRLVHSTSTAAVTIENSTIGPSGTEYGNNGVTILGSSTADVTVTVENSTIQGQQAAGLLTTFSGDSQQTITIQNSTFSGSNAGIDLGTNGSADLTFTVQDNQFTGHTRQAINIVSGEDATREAVVRGWIDGNTIGNASVDSGSLEGYGIALDLRGDVDAVVSVTNNTVQHTELQGIYAAARLDDDEDGETGLVDLTLTGNIVGPPDNNSAFPLPSVYGLNIEARHTTQMCLDLRENSVQGQGTEDIHLSQSDASQFMLAGFSGDGSVDAEVVSFIVTQNPGVSASVSKETAFSSADGGCRVP